MSDAGGRHGAGRRRRRGLASRAAALRVPKGATPGDGRSAVKGSLPAATRVTARWADNGLGIRLLAMFPSSRTGASPAGKAWAAHRYDGSGHADERGHQRAIETPGPPTVAGNSRFAAGRTPPSSGGRSERSKTPTDGGGRPHEVHEAAPATSVTPTIGRIPKRLPRSGLSDAAFDHAGVGHEQFQPGPAGGRTRRSPGGGIVRRS